MKSYYKIAIGFILLVLLVGVVSAVNADDFKYPDSFKKSTGTDGYINDQGQGMIVFNYEDSKAMFLTEHDKYAFNYYGNNTYVFADATSGLAGFFEVVEFNGEKVIVISSILSENVDKHGVAAYDNLMEFNRLNDVEPISV